MLTFVNIITIFASFYIKHLEQGEKTMDSLLSKLLHIYYLKYILNVIDQSTFITQLVPLIHILQL